MNNIEDEIEKMACDYSEGITHDFSEQNNLFSGYMAGYKAALQKQQYTKSDMINLIEWCGGEEGFNLIDEDETSELLFEKYQLSVLKGETQSTEQSNESEDEIERLAKNYADSWWRGDHYGAGRLGFKAGYTYKNNIQRTER